jgi:hypothetical protein
MYRGQLNAYKRALHLPLTADQRQLVERMITRTGALENFEAGKEAFYEGDFVKARDLLRRANPVLSRKQKLLARMFEHAPSALFRIAKVRQWLMPRYQRIA